MKKKLLLLPLLAGFAYVTLSSNSGGYGSNATGSTGSGTPGCGGGGCHGSSSTSTLVVGITVDSAGTLITQYTPGNTYRITILGTNLSSSLMQFGFQLSTVKSSDNSQAGSFVTSSFPTGTDLNVSTPRELFGHTTPLTDSMVGTTSIYVKRVLWTAPAAGTGNVKIYGVINAVNGDGNASATDKWNTANTTISERIPTSIGNVTISNDVYVYPNPSVGQLNIEVGHVTNGYNISVFDISGKLIHSGSGTESSFTLDTHNWSAGVYNVIVNKDGVNTSYKIAKQ